MATDEELKKELFGEDEPKSPQPSEEKKPEKAPEPSEEEKAAAKVREEVANLSKAKEEALAELQRIRKDTKEAKAKSGEEEELPKLDENDPSVKRWQKEIKDTVSPVAAELEKEKQEIFEFSLNEFLKDRPSLSKSPEKLKAVISTYERIRTSSGRTREGILMDLDKAYAAEYHEELISAARSARVEQARNDELFAGPAVSRGSTVYQSDQPAKKVYSEEEKEIIRRWEGSGAPKLD